MRQVVTLLIIATLTSCSVSSKLQRRESTATLTQLSSEQREMRAEQRRDTIITQTKRESHNLYEATIDRKSGETMLSMQMEQVTVVSNLRVVPERGGEVTLDFVVTIPKELLGSSRNVVISPQLHSEERVEKLEDLTIRGVLVDKIQRRDYWQYETFVTRYTPTEQGAQQMFNRLVKFPRPKDARLDSLIENRSHIIYYYSQNIKTDEGTKRLKITLDGRVEGVDNTIYRMPPSDTLSYTVSSMLSFLDTAPRFKIKIIDKYITVNDRNYILFNVGDSRVIDTLGNNKSELEKMESLMERIVKQQEFHVDSITLTATSSPEGEYRFNERLSERRAKALKARLGSDSLKVRWVAEDWAELRRLIAGDDKVSSRSAIIRIIDDVKDADLREAQIRSQFPLDYAHIRSTLYPKLRAVEVRYNLRRKGMVKDTIQTTELDTMYARGVKLLQQRSYAKALYILNDYKDRNTIIALLSMTHNDEALNLLEKQESTATTHYLRAIALSRLSRIEEALEAYKLACELEPRMEFRANLDPEIFKLLKQ